MGELDTAVDNLHEIPQTLAKTSVSSKVSYDELRLRREVAAVIGKKLSHEDDREKGALYIAQAHVENIEGRGLVRIGWTTSHKHNHVRMIETVCKQPVRDAWATPRFQGAKRVEAIIHKMLQNEASNERHCDCGLVDNEWFEVDVDHVKSLFLTLLRWMEWSPYDFKTGELRPEWKRAWENWKETFERQRSESITDFLTKRPTGHIRQALFSPNSLFRNVKIHSIATPSRPQILPTRSSPANRMQQSHSYHPQTPNSHKSHSDSNVSIPPLRSKGGIDNKDEKAALRRGDVSSATDNQHQPTPEAFCRVISNAEGQYDKFREANLQEDCLNREEVEIPDIFPDENFDEPDFSEERDVSCTAQDSTTMTTKSDTKVDELETLDVPEPQRSQQESKVPLSRQDLMPKASIQEHVCPSSPASPSSHVGTSSVSFDPTEWADVAWFKDPNQRQVNRINIKRLKVKSHEDLLNPNLTATNSLRRLSGSLVPPKIAQYQLIADTTSINPPQDRLPVVVKKPWRGKTIVVRLPPTQEPHRILNTWCYFGPFGRRTSTVCGCSNSSCS